MSMILNPYRHAAAGGPTFGNASRDFDGVNDFIETSDPIFAFDDSDTFSIAYWIYADTWSASGIVGTWNPNEFSAGWFLGIRSFGGSYFQGGFLGPSGSGGRLNRTSATFSTGTWYHVGMSNDGSSSLAGIKIYINGSLASVVSVADGEAAYDMGQKIEMGVNRYSTDIFFDGKMADVRVYDAELAPSDFSDLAAGTNVSTNLIGWWLTDDDDVLDYSGNENHGTNNGTTYSTDGPLD